LPRPSRYWHRERPYLILPVSFRVGAELQKLRLAMVELSDLINESENASDDLAALSEKAVELIWRYSIPEHPIKALRKKCRLLSNPLREATDGEVLDLVNFFFAAPDAFELSGQIDLGDGVPNGTPIYIDILDQLLEFVHYLPAWLGEDKLPLSWRHFKYGLDHIRRLKARNALAAADAARMSQVDMNAWNEWRSTQRSAARF
jgi:hypothetical protein